jgi:HME family heavy-metal exporter
LPVMATYLLPSALKKVKKQPENTQAPDLWFSHDDTVVVKYIKRLTRSWINRSLRYPKAIFIGMLLCVPLTMFLYTQAGKEWLPELNEPSLTLWVVTPLWSSLEYMREVADSAAAKILEVEWVKSIAMTLWRAEADAHANGPNIAELEVHTDKSIRSQEAMIIDIQKIADEYKGIANFSVWRPITHRIQELQSWVRAPIVVKVFGSDLEVLDWLTTQILAQIEWVDGIVNAQMKQEKLIPQVSLEVDKAAALSLWVELGEVIEQVENGLLGIKLSEILDDAARYPLVLKFDPSWTNDLRSLSTLPLVIGEKTVSLWQIADVKMIDSPNSISHDNLQRRKVISAFVQWRDVVSAVEEIREAVWSLVIPSGYTVSYEWDYASQKAANRQLLLVWLAVLWWIYLVLLTVLRKHNIVLQVLLDVLTAFLWGMIAVALSGNVISTAHMVWFVSLLGIVSRNGILLVEHYMNLMKDEWMEFDVDLIMKWSLERVIPVLMTVLTSWIALLPLIVWAWSEAWKEILAPIAIVTFGGLIFSSIIEVFLRPWVFYWMNKGKNLIEDESVKI